MKKQFLFTTLLAVSTLSQTAYASSTLDQTDLKEYISSKPLSLTESEDVTDAFVKKAVKKLDGLTLLDIINDEYWIPSENGKEILDFRLQNSKTFKDFFSLNEDQEADLISALSKTAEYKKMVKIFSGELTGSEKIEAVKKYRKENPLPNKK